MKANLMWVLPLKYKGFFILLVAEERVNNRALALYTLQAFSGYRTQNAQLNSVIVQMKAFKRYFPLGGLNFVIWGAVSVQPKRVFLRFRVFIVVWKQ